MKPFEEYQWLRLPSQFCSISFRVHIQAVYLEVSQTY